MALDLSSATITPPLQGFVFSDQMGPGQLYAVGGAYYYITIAQVGVAEATNLLTIYKSTDILTWSIAATLPAAIPPQSNVNSQDAPCIVVGSKIYIVGVVLDAGFSPAHVFLQLHIFDTVTDTFSESSLSVNQGGAGQQMWSLSIQNDGTFVVTSTKVSPTAFTYLIYDPGLDTWSGAVTIVANGSRVLQQVHDSVTDFTYIFYITPLNALRCYTIDPLGSPTDVQILATFFPIANVGTSIIASSTGEVILTYRRFVSGTSTLFVARSDTTNPPVFSIDTVEDSATLPGQQVQQFDQIASGGWFPIEIDGLLYVFYAMDNGELNNASSESWIYYRTSTGPGVWSVPTLAYTAPIPTELLTPYGTVAADGTFVMMLGLIDPTLWTAYASLSNVVLYTTTFTPPDYAYLNAQSLMPVILPDPSKGRCG